MDNAAYYKTHKLRQNAQSMRRLWERTHNLTTNWAIGKTPCKCEVALSKPHNVIGYKSGARWYVMCPINYYLLLAWRAVANGDPVPDNDLYWRLLGKDVPQDE